MEKNILIADSGSTKTDWAWVSGGKLHARFQTQGINPYMLDSKEMTSILMRELRPLLPLAPIQYIYFYGAGCRGEQVEVVEKVLQQVLAPQETTEVHSDLLGAARAVCGKEDGVACILGTGSNSCLFCQGEIESNVSPLGFILGDEGSGAVLGRLLLGDVLKKQLPDHLIDDFHKTYSMSLDDIIHHTYKEAFPNRFLASFTPFLFHHKEEPTIHALLTDEFGRFFRRNVAAYHHPELKVNFVGSIAHYFQKEIAEAAGLCGFRMGRTLRTPMEGLLEFHLS